MNQSICFAVLLLTGWAKAAQSASLPDAAEAKAWDLIPALLKSSDPNQAQADGTTALHWASHHGHTATVQRLLGAGADAATENRYEVTPLSLACITGNATIVDALLDAGADPNSTLPGGETALMTAARTGKPGPVELLLAAGANLTAQERKGQTALMWAAAEGHAEVVQVLLDAGADPDAALKSGFTPLFFAARNGCTAVVETLLAAGVDVNHAFDYKSGGKAPPAGTSALRLAVENGHFDLAIVLLKAGADPNDQRSGFTPLHVLTWVRKPNRGDGFDGMPPPKGSGETTSLEFARRLMTEFGAEVNTALRRGSSGGHRLGTKGATPFLLAAKTADLPYLQLLHQHGADPAIPNADGTLPLMAAAGLGTHAPTEEAGTEAEALETVAWLIDLGCPLDRVNKDGETAMHGAAYKSLPKMITFLDAQGADIAIWNQKNKRGRTPLHIAQGYRPGNFKPAPETVAALEAVFHKKGIDPRSLPAADAARKKGYEP